MALTREEMERKIKALVNEVEVVKRNAELLRNGMYESPFEAELGQDTDSLDAAEKAAQALAVLLCEMSWRIKLNHRQDTPPSPHIDPASLKGVSRLS